MGDLLRSLGIGSKSAPSANLGSILQHVGGGVTPGDEPMGGLPQDPLAALPQSTSSPDGPDITVTGDSWHPHKESVLGAIADAIMMHQGLKPAFKNKNDEKNQMEAMMGFDQNPSQAIHRLSQIPGMEQKAQDLWDKNTDNVRQQGNLDRQNKVFDLKLEDYVRDRTAGMMETIKPGDKEGYKRMRDRALAYGSAKGVDLSADLPENGDSLDVDALRYGQIDPYKIERLKQFDNQEEGRNTRAAVSESGKNTRAAVTEGGKNSRFQQGQSATQGRFDTLHPPVKKFMTPQGPAEMSPDGQHFRLMKNKSVWELKGNGKAVRVK